MNFESEGERIALNAAMLRLFKGQYRNSVDRHSDALFVKDGLEMALAANASLTLDVKRLREALVAIHVQLMTNSWGPYDVRGIAKIASDAVNAAALAPKEGERGAT